MTFEPLSLVPVLGVAAAVSGSIAAAFHANGMGYDHFRRAGPLALAAAGFFLAFLFFSLLRGPGHVMARADGLGAALAGAIVVAAAALGTTALAWNRLGDQGRLGLPDPRHPVVGTLAIGLAVVAVMGLALLAQDVFASHPVVPAAASGFHIVALTCMVIWVGIAVLVSSAATAHAFTGRTEWADVALPWTRAAFLVALVGLAAGHAGTGFPSDAATMRTWLAAFLLVPLIHGLIYYRKKRLLSVLTPFCGALLVPAAMTTMLASAVGESSIPGVPARILALPLVLAALPATAWLTRLAVASHGSRRWFAATAGGALVGLAAVPVARPDVFVRLQVAPDEVLTGGILAAAVVALAWAWRSRMRSPPEEPFLDRWIQMAPLVKLGMWTLATGLLALVTLETLGRLPSIRIGIGVATVPVLLIMGVALSNQTLGRRTSLVGAALAVAIGLLLWGTLSELGIWDGFTLFLVPIAGFALLGALLKLVGVSDSPTAPGPIRVAGAVLFLGGIVAVATWTGPEFLAAAPGFLQPARPWAPLGVALGLVAVAGGISAQRRRHHRLAFAGSIALSLSLPWAFPLGLALVVFLARQAGSFEAGRSWFERPRGLQREFRKTGVYLIHVAIALLAMSLATDRLGWSGAWMAGIGVALVLLAGGASFEAAKKGKA